MKPIRELSQSELWGFIFDAFNIRHDAEAECVLCGKNRDAEYWYLCDGCDASLSEEFDKLGRNETPPPNQT